MADLLRRIPLPLKLDCLERRQLSRRTEISGEVIFHQVALPDIADRHILILDDILDSGVTLAAVRQKLETAGPLSVRVCVLLQKERARLAGKRRITSASKSKTNSSSATASITWSAIAICRASASSERS